MKHEFKVGDRVRIRRWDDMVAEFGLSNAGSVATPIVRFLHEMKHLCGRTATISIMSDRGRRAVLKDWSSADGDIGWAYCTKMLEPIEPVTQQKIVITTDGKTTLARLYEGKKVVKSAEAKCSPEDKFDFNIGANIAFERLVKPTPKVEKFDWEEFKSGKFVVHCDSREKAKAFLRECHSKGIAWFSNRSLLESDYYREFDNGTCYHMAGGGLMFGSRDYYLNNGFKINEYVVSEPIKPAFDWDAFKRGEIAVHCDTKKKAKEFLSACHEKELKWIHGNSLVEDFLTETFYKYKNEGVCYGFSHGGIGHSDLKYAQECFNMIIKYPFDSTES